LESKTIPIGSIFNTGEINAALGRPPKTNKMLSGATGGDGRSQLVKLFRRNGLSIKPDAMDYCLQLVDSLGQSASNNIEDFIKRLSAQLLSRHRTLFVSCFSFNVINHSGLFDC
jgi:hypothetical protein